MTQVIMVLGGVEERAGKTTMAKAVCKALAKKYRVQFCKPIAGHNSWYHYDHLLNCLAQKKLFSKDAFEVRGELAFDAPIEVINPIDCLFSPLKYESSLCGSKLSRAVLERFALLSNRAIKNVFLRLGTREMDTVLVDPEALNQLISSADKVYELEDWRSMEGELIGRAITSCLGWLKERADVVVVEGHDDRCPVMDDDLSLAMVVAPGHLAIYEGDEFRRGFYSVLDLRAEVSVRDVIPLINPLESYEIKPVTINNTDQMSKFEEGIREIIYKFL